MDFLIKRNMILVTSWDFDGMNEVNIYIHEPCNASISIARKIRKWGSRKVHLWVSEGDLKHSSPDIQRIVRNWRDGKCVDRNLTVDSSFVYCEWDLANWVVTNVVSDGLKAVVTRCRSQELEFLVLGTSEKCKGQMVAFVDASHDDRLPDEWCKLHWMTTYESIFDFCRQHNVFDFDLNNATFYRKTTMHRQGASVYEELKTGHFIYLDNLHKDHYEVFDSNRRHLGEMSLTGVLDRSSADNRKQL